MVKALKLTIYCNVCLKNEARYQSGMCGTCDSKQPNPTERNPAEPNETMAFKWDIEGSVGCAICPFERQGRCIHNDLHGTLKIDVEKPIPEECPLRKGATLVHLDGSEDEPWDEEETDGPE